MLGRTIGKGTPDVVYENGEPKQEFCLENTYNNDGTSGHYKTIQTYTFKCDDGSKLILKYYIYYYNGWTSKNSKMDTSNSSSKEISPARVLQPIVSAWYVTLRNIALVALLSILVYIGIRITLSSVSSDKAKYKQMLVDWVVALCLVFLMHYIMAFAVYINEKIIDAISSITTTNLYDPNDFSNNADYVTSDSKQTIIDDENKDEQAAGVQLFIIKNNKAVEAAYDTFVGDEGKNSTFYSRFAGLDNDGKPTSGTVLFWPANDFMTQARLLGQGATVKEGEDDPDLNSKNVSVARAGYNIIYVVLVIYTIIFCFTYLKRLIYLAFLTIIAPLVAITYPIDKINDGQAQAFNMWLKEYIFNLLIQPMHLILYTILVGSAMEFAAINIFYVVVALGFLTPAEKLLRRFFGFEKAQTPGVFAGPAASALMMSGINNMMHKPPKGALGAGGKGGESNGTDDEEKLQFMNKRMDDTEGLFNSNNIKSTKENILGNGNGKSNDNNNNNNIEYDKRLSEEQIDELKAEGIEPGDQEYNHYLR